MTMTTRRTFLSAALAAGASLAAAGSAGLAGAARPLSRALADEASRDEAGKAATAATAEEAGEVVSDDGLRELVDMPLPGNQGVDYGHVSPDPAGSEGTVLSASLDPARSQQLFLWEEGRMPAATSPSHAGNDPQGFRPTVTSVPAAPGVPVKGAVLLCAGGAFALRGDCSDCYPTANALAARGYQCFVVDYRLRPYTQAEGGLDLARAIRFVRARWQDYGLPSERCIAVGGYSAGGILCGETLLNQGGSHSPAEVDPAYVPDELDGVDASVAADAMVYSFYGRLSWAEKSGEVLRAGDLPPTFYCYGTEDPFFDQFEGQVDLMASLGYRVRARVLEGWPHGFGAEGGWVPEFDAFMQEAFARA